MITNTGALFPWTRNSRFIETGFLRLLRRELKHYDNAEKDATLEKVENLASTVFKEDHSFVVDQYAQQHLLLVSYVLAAYEVLRSIVENEKALSIVRLCVIENGAFFIKWGFTIGLWLAPNKFGYILNNCGMKAKESFGKSFEIKIETDGRRKLKTIVHRCGFHELFVKHAQPELTRLLCEWDNNWSNVLQGNSKIQFERPCTIANGNKHCEFIYKKA